MKSRLVCVMAFGLPFLCLAGCVGVRSDRLGSGVLQNEAVRLGLGPRGAIWTLAEQTSGTDFVRGEPTGPLWIVELRDAAGNLMEVDSTQHGDFAMKRIRRGGLALKWRGPEIDVRVTVRPEDRNRRLLRWGMTIDNHSDRWGIWTVNFPLIHGLATGSDAYYAWPNGIGAVVREPLRHLPMWGPYPVRAPSMQFSVVGSRDAALYLAVEDPEGRLKEIRLEDDGDGAARYRVTNFPEEMGKVGRDFRLPYEVVTGLLDGDWIDACKLYRSWAIRQKWCPPPLVERDDVPAWFPDIAVWLHCNRPQQEVLDFAEFIDAPIAIHWYNWHHHPFDDTYPDYFPAKPWVVDWSKRLREAGIRTVPYINGRLWDIAASSYEAEGAARYAIVNPFLTEPGQDRSYSTRERDGKHVNEHYGKCDFAVMCPGTRFWQDKVAGLCERIVEELGVDGVYLDQTGCHTAKLCFNPAHGHATAGGEPWTSGNRKLTRKCRERMRAVNPEAVLATEGNSEAYSATDALLTIYDSVEVDELVGLAPLYQYVYSDRKVTFGRMTMRDKTAFLQQFAQCFVWGTQMGWDSIWEPAKMPREPYGRYLKELSRVYGEEAKRFTQYGEMLRPATLLTDVPTGTANWRAPVTLPYVLHSRWRAPDSAIGLVATNWGEKPQTVVFDIEGKLELNLAPYSAQVVEIGG